MENKYYTPNTEELHHGFECEAYIRFKWHNVIVQNRDAYLGEKI